jgi:hypothetical protein
MPVIIEALTRFDQVKPFSLSKLTILDEYHRIYNVDAFFGSERLF